jgi:hypothetical protein
MGNIAKRMLREHDLQIHQVEIAEGRGTVVDVTRESILMDDRLANMPFRWMVTLATGVAKSSMCQVVYYDKARTLSFIGRPMDIEVAKTLYIFLRDQMKIMANYAAQYKNPNRVHAMAYKPAYLHGLSIRVQQRLVEDFERAQREERGVGALVLLWDKAIVNYMQENMRVKTDRSQYRPNNHTDAYRQGYHDGDSVRIRKEVQS